MTYFRVEDNIIRNVLNFTIFIKNEATFKILNKKELAVPFKFKKVSF